MPSSSLPFLTAFESLLAEFSAKLVQIPEETAGTSLEPGKWSAKQELGHLIDSALNNHIRLIRMQIEARPELPGYEQNEWVRLNRYQSRPWAEIIGLWRMLNQHLLAAASQVVPRDWERIGIFTTPWQPMAGEATDEVTLRFLIEDYVEHMRHHLEHLLRWRE